VNKQTWQLKIPLDAILFDCDGTLSSIEGIDELAALAGPEIAHTVKVLTEEAMGRSGIDPDLYEKRLALVNPTQSQVEALSQLYFEHQAPYVVEVIALLQRLGKTIYILSAGLLPAVVSFAKQLNISPQHVFAVDIQFDAEGRYQGFDSSSPLIHNTGKRSIVEKIKQQHQQLLYTGDGLNDLAVRDLVARFVGYGGSYYRQNIADQCEFYIKAQSFLPLLPLALTREEYEKLSMKEKMLYDEGVVLMA
jgi:phosphoserine phosphatase